MASLSTGSNTSPTNNTDGHDVAGVTCKERSCTALMTSGLRAYRSERVAEGYRAMDERRAIKTLLRP